MEGSLDASRFFCLLAYSALKGQSGVQLRMAAPLSSGAAPPSRPDSSGPCIAAKGGAAPPEAVPAAGAEQAVRARAAAEQAAGSAHARAPDSIFAQGGTAAERSAWRGPLGAIRNMGDRGGPSGGEMQEEPAGAPATLAELRDAKGRTPLMLAAWCGHDGVLSALLEEGASVHATDHSGLSTLSWAAQSAAPEAACKAVVDKLISARAKVDHGSSNGATPLMLAAGAGRACIVDILLRATQRGTFVHDADTKECTALSYAAMRLQGAGGGTCVQPQEAGGYAAVVRALVKAGAKVNHRCRQDLLCEQACGSTAGAGVTSLLLAARSDSGLAVDIAAMAGLTPLMLAAHSGNVAALAALLERGADVRLRDAEQRVALSYAAIGGCSDALLKLLTAPQGREFLEHADACERTPLLLAARSNQLDCLKALLKLKADVLAVDVDGWSALSMVCGAARDGHAAAEAVTALLDAEADIEHSTELVRTPLYLAARRGSAETVAVLLERGADVKFRTVPQQGTPLIAAAWHGHAGTVGLMLRIKPRRIYAADTNAADADGDTALANAIISGLGDTTGTVRVLLATDDINHDAQNGRGHTALMCAIGCGNVPVVKLLLQCDGNLPLKDTKGYTALHHAAMHGNLDVVRLLLHAGASAMAASARDELPIDVIGMHTADMSVCLDKAAKTASGQHGDAGGVKADASEPADLALTAATEEKLQAVQSLLSACTSAAQLVETEGFRSILNGISIVAVLIVTVTLLGLQTPPGGPSDSEGGLVKLKVETYEELHDRTHPKHLALVQRTALRAYSFLDGLSLFLAASDLLLVLTFLLPGVSTFFRKQEQAAWVWLMLVSCTVLLTAALLCAVGAYVAAGVAVIPPEEYAVLICATGIGGVILSLAFMLLLGFIWSVRPVNAGQFVFGTLHRALGQTTGLRKKRMGWRKGLQCERDGDATAVLASGLCAAHHAAW